MSWLFASPSKDKKKDKKKGKSKSASTTNLKSPAKGGAREEERGADGDTKGKALNSVPQPEIASGSDGKNTLDCTIQSNDSTLIISDRDQRRYEQLLEMIVSDHRCSLLQWIVDGDLVRLEHTAQPTRHLSLQLMRAFGYVHDSVAAAATFQKSVPFMVDLSYCRIKAIPRFPDPFETFQKIVSRRNSVDGSTLTSSLENGMNVVEESGADEKVEVSEQKLSTEASMAAENDRDTTEKVLSAEKSKEDGGREEKLGSLESNENDAQESAPTFSERKEAHDFNGAQSGDDGQKNTAQEARPMEVKSDFPAAEDKKANSNASSSETKTDLPDAEEKGVDLNIALALQKMTKENSEVLALDLSINSIRNIHSLKALPGNILVLDLSGNLLKSLSGISQLVPNLQAFVCSDNILEDLSGLENSTKIRYLNISGNRINSLSMIEQTNLHLPMLEELDASENLIEDVSLFSGVNGIEGGDSRSEPFPALTSLNLSGNSLVSWPYFSKSLQKLKQLDISRNRISSFNGLIESLDALNCKLETINVLGNTFDGSEMTPIMNPNKILRKRLVAGGKHSLQSVNLVKTSAESPDAILKEIKDQKHSDALAKITEDYGHQIEAQRRQLEQTMEILNTKQIDATKQFQDYCESMHHQMELEITNLCAKRERDEKAAAEAVKAEKEAPAAAQQVEEQVRLQETSESKTHSEPSESEERGSNMNETKQQEATEKAPDEEN